MCYIQCFRYFHNDQLNNCFNQISIQAIMWILRSTTVILVVRNTFLWNTKCHHCPCVQVWDFSITSHSNNPVAWFFSDLTDHGGQSSMKYVMYNVWQMAFGCAKQHSVSLKILCPVVKCDISVTEVDEISSYLLSRGHFKVCYLQ